MSDLSVKDRLLNSIIAVFAKLGLPGAVLPHWLRYGPQARNLKLSRGAHILCRELKMTGRVTLKRGARIQGDAVELGQDIVLGPGVAVTARKVSFADRVRIDEGTTVGGGQLESSEVELGAGVWIFPHCYINTTTGLFVGEGTGIGGYCMIWTHGSWQNYMQGFPVSYAPTRLGKNVWLPWHVIVMPGVTIGDNVTVGAGSVVSRSVPANSLCAGVPAKVLKTGEESWPVNLPPEDVEARFTEIVEHFSHWIGGHFDVRQLLMFAGKRYTARSDNGVFVFEDGVDRPLHIVTGTELPSGLDERRTLMVGKTAELKARNWVALTHEQCVLQDKHELFLKFFSFLTHYGIRVRPE